MPLLLAAVEQNADAPDLVAQNIAFGLIAFMMVVCAIKVVTTKNVVHAALYLVLVLAGVAAQYILLAAEFLASVQVLVYIGAIIVLFLFGIMLTRAPIKGEDDHTRNWIGGVVTAAGLLVLLGYTLIDQYGSSKLPEEVGIGRAEVLSDSIFSTYLFPFEVVSILLTAALVGAIVIARKD
jgi:NADH-quinone oxidoreductase subunit J